MFQATSTPMTLTIGIDQATARATPGCSTRPGRSSRRVGSRRRQGPCERGSMAWLPHESRLRWARLATALSMR